MKRLENLFAGLTFICFIFLILGLIKPNAVIYWGANENKTRKRVLLYYGITTLVFLFALGATVPELTPEQKAELAIKRQAEENAKAEAKAKQEAEEKAKSEEKAKLEAEARAKQEAEEKAKAEEKERLEAEAKEQFISSAQQINYKDLARNPDKYKSSKVFFIGQVVQTLESENDVVLLVSVTQDQYGYNWNDAIYVNYTRSPGESRILEKDIIRLWGTMKGLKTYTSTRNYLWI